MPQQRKSRSTRASTLRELVVESDSSYSIVGSGTIQLNGTDSRADVAVRGGDHTIEADLVAFVDTTIDIAPGASLTVSDALIFNLVTLTKEGEGTLYLNGNTSSGSGQLDVHAGVLAGSGTVRGDLTAVGGIVAPGESIGTLDVNGDFALDPQATLQIEVGGGSDLLNVTGDATLAGDLEVVLAGGTQPQLGQQFLIMIAGSVTDLGLSLSGPHADNFELNVFSNTLILRSLFEGLAGDFNGNGIVDVADYALWRNTLGQNVSAGQGADGNGNGVVDQADYDLWKTNFGNSNSQSSNLSAVPEPSTGILILLTLLCKVAVTLRVTIAGGFGGRLGRWDANAPIAPQQHAR